MPKPSAQVTAAEISRIAGVTRATISNWRRRHDDFPTPAGGTEASPLYDLEAVRSWLRRRGHTSAATPAEELRTLLRLYGGGTIPRLLPLVLGASRRSSDELKDLADLPETELIARADTAASELAEEVPDAAAARFGPEDAPTLRALVRCVREQSAQAALDVLAERELDDSASSGTYSTPSPLADLMAGFLPSSDASRVLDPACGSGTLLEATARRGAHTLYGQDSVPVQARRSAVRLLLAAPDARVTVRTGDSLRTDAFPEITVDAVLCNPPYADRDWGHDELAYDSRWVHGLPARAESELAWVQHSLAHLEPGGRAVLLLPPAVASRPSGRRVRTQLVRSGALRAVIGLPTGAAPPLHIGLQLWVFQRPDPDGAERKSVLFADVSGGSEEAETHYSVGSPSSASRVHRRQAAIRWDHLSAGVLEQWASFAAAPDSFVDRPGVARTVPLINLLDELVDLTPARQVRAAPADIDPAEVAATAADRRKRLSKSIAALGEAAQLCDWSPVDDGAHAWRTATVADLVRGSALELMRPTLQAPDGLREAWREENAGRPVLTGTDVARGERASGELDDLTADTSPVVAEGDVLVRGLAGGSGFMTRVADADDAGCVLGASVHLLRPDPARLDPWFLAGFLDAEDNIAGASSGSTTIHVQPGRLRVPLLPLEEQRRYGETFRHIRALRSAARQAADLAHETAQVVTSGLTAGALLPPPPDGSA